MIAVDGPAASGKSTIARNLARALSWRYINSGALYRAIAHEFLTTGVDPGDQKAVDLALDRFEIRCDESGERHAVRGQDVTEALRTREVSVMASVVARLPCVRDKVNSELRRLAKDAPCVMEGRDIGTVVFPDAAYKVYLEASPEERARRRQIDYARMGCTASQIDIQRELAERDQQDSTRAVAPLRPPE
ncbi:MAG: (d)CMP kinase [Candidatus Riflebacteria bacterium]|nr:(d)CMP kinase [Candidatus Riflebacteria bacterium]